MFNPINVDKDGFLKGYDDEYVQLFREEGTYLIKYFPPETKLQSFEQDKEIYIMKIGDVNLRNHQLEKKEGFTLWFLYIKDMPQSHTQDLTCAISKAKLEDSDYPRKFINSLNELIEVRKELGIDYYIGCPK